MFLDKVKKNKNIKKPVIFGFSSTELTDEEKSFFKEVGPLGFIIFKRNIDNKKQLKALTDSLRELMDGEVLILIDQEGGRVARLNEPNWNKYPTGEYFSKLYDEDEKKAKKELFENFQKIADDLVEVGINIDCAPVLDVLSKKTHDVIGNRAYGDTAQKVAQLGKVVCEALLSKDVYPVIKHIPGHGLGACDSHLELPVVDESLKQLRNNDFIPFKELNDQKFAMTAHIKYSNIDKDNCATMSKNAIALIRNEIGFKNVLMSDDLSMKALTGDFATRTKKTLEAGCDLILHCNGNMEEMQAIYTALPEIRKDLLNKL
ncbi:MAG: beta-N-acetylhexosaminidase [Rickettsiales bacterium]|nr:beta-N-acetylhexosaminidase [Rickettsiales bacterium]